MTILDEREPTISLKLIIAIVSLVTVAAFACMLTLNATKSANASTSASHAAAPDKAQTEATGNI